MSILIVLIGATIGATIGSLFMHWRKDVAKERQQLESKTPYDYALTNAINERDRLQDELRTIRALKRTEADTERIRNEIVTILSDDGEEATEGTYGEERRRREFIAVGKRWEANMKELHGDWEIPRIVKPTSDGRGYMDNVRKDDSKDEQSTEDDVDKAFMDSTDLTFRQYYDVIKTTDDKRHPAARAALERERQDEDLGIIVEELTALKVEMEEKQRRLFEDGVIPIQEQADGTSSQAPGEAQITLEEWAQNVSKAFSTYGTNVREDGAEDERLAEDDEERSYIQSVGQAFRDRTIVCVVCSKARYLGEVTAFTSEHGELTELQVNGIDIRVEAVLEIRKGDDINGETLYRKGNR